MTFLSIIQEDLDDTVELDSPTLPVPNPDADLQKSFLPHSTYLREKSEGKRLANGVKPLKKLTQRHFRIINLYIGGESLTQIAGIMGCTVGTIWRIVNDPLAEPYLATAYKARQGEIDAMLGKNIDAVRDVLDKGTNRERLTAVGVYTKLKESVASDTRSSETAEDFAKAIVQAATDGAENVNIQINQEIQK